MKPSNIQVRTADSGVYFAFESMKFAGGEMHVRSNAWHYAGTKLAVVITANLHSSDDIMELLLVTDAIRRRDMRAEIKVHIPYLPYARQDRVCASGEALSLRVMCDLINAQRYDEVTISDPHSDVAPALLNRCRVIPQAYFLRELWRDFPEIRKSILVAPDAGAMKKIGEASKLLNVQYIRADKTRDPADGRITGTVVHLGESEPGTLMGRSMLIVDDICDGGRTFVELAAELRRLGFPEVNLFVTHGIFSKGFEVFDGLIDNVFTSYPFADLPPHRRGLGLTQFHKTKGIA